MRSDCFTDELRLISDNKLRAFIADYLDKVVPPYFYYVPASSSGKYHPEYALGSGGLVRHTKACVVIAEHLLSLEQNAVLAELHHDDIIAALIVHDTFKSALNAKAGTAFNHPILSAKAIHLFAQEYHPLMEHRAYEIARLVMSHMGQWNRKGNVVLPKPDTDAQKFVHMCDYLASRKDIAIDVKYEPPKEE